MNAQAVIKESIQQTYVILENIDRLLQDAEETLVTHGFECLHSGLQCDISKQSAARMMPYHISAFYVQGKPEDKEPGRCTLGIAVLLTDNNLTPIEPLLVGAVFQPRDANTPYAAWWVHSAVMSPGLEEPPLPSLPPLSLPVTLKKGSIKSKATYWYDQAYAMAVPLTEISTPELLEERLIKPLLDLYEGITLL